MPLSPLDVTEVIILRNRYPCDAHMDCLSLTKESSKTACLGTVASKWNERRPSGSDIKVRAGKSLWACGRKKENEKQ